MRETEENEKKELELRFMEEKRNTEVEHTNIIKELTQTLNDQLKLKDREISVLKTKMSS